MPAKIKYVEHTKVEGLALVEHSAELNFDIPASGSFSSIAAMKGKMTLIGDPAECSLNYALLREAPVGEGTGAAPGTERLDRLAQLKLAETKRGALFDAPLFVSRTA